MCMRLSMCVRVCLFSGILNDISTTFDVSVTLAADFTVQLVSFGAASIPPGTWQIAQLQIGSSTNINAVCIDDVKVFGGDNGPAPFSVLCNSEGFAAQAIFETVPVTSDGTLTVRFQSQVQISGFQFDIFDLDGNTIEVLGAGGGLAGNIYVYSLSL